MLRDAGHASLADHLQHDIVGRNALFGRWTFQIVEEFDDGYYSNVRAAERQVRDDLMDGRRHVYESEMKDAERTANVAGHERRPVDPV
jgi:hypothetical protein